MGRGPGAWQRLILDALRHTEAVPAVVVATARYGNPERSDYVAVRRAIKALVLQGKARAIYCYLPTWDGARFTPQLVVTRPESTMEGTASPSGGTPSWITRPATDRVRLSTRAIAQVVGVSPSTVSRDLRKASRHATRRHP